MAREIEVFSNSAYMGFRRLYDIDEMFYESFEKAYKMSQYIDWDEVILFAIYCFHPITEALVAVDFLNLRLDYWRYAELCSKLSENCRLFHVKNGQGGFYY